MTKTIDIHKPVSTTSSMGLAKIHRAGKPEEEKPAPEEKPLIAPKVRDSFISRFLAVAVFDVKRKFGLVKSPPGEFQRKISDFEKFEEFCRIARGER